MTCNSMSTQWCGQQGEPPDHVGEERSKEIPFWHENNIPPEDSHQILPQRRVLEQLCQSHALLSVEHPPIIYKDIHRLLSIYSRMNNFVTLNEARDFVTASRFPIQVLLSELSKIVYLDHGNELSSLFTPSQIQLSCCFQNKSARASNLEPGLSNVLPYSGELGEVLVKRYSRGSSTAHELQSSVNSYVMIEKK